MGWIALVVLVGAGACKEDRPTPHKDDATAPSATASAGSTRPGVDCKAYCSKLQACFPNVVDPDVVALWPGQCAADCTRDLSRGSTFGTVTKAVAACTEAACGEPLGICIDEQLTAMKADRDDHRYLGLHPWCTVSHACFVAGFYGYVDPESRDRLRATLGPTRDELYGNTRRTSSDPGTVCRMMVETECAPPAALSSEGPAITVDCDAYCDKLRTCAPKKATDDAWLGNCRTSCREEATAGTTYAAFYAAVARCAEAPCGDALGACIAKRVAEHWPTNPGVDWDMRHVGADCQLVRLCHEATHNAAEPAVSRLGRRAQFGYYAKHHEGLSDVECGALRDSARKTSGCF